ncbi:MAG TPA: DinB family protein [Methylomirabilota bacterium]|nr:DinB family protein [Methylomirabilota bacterium]
MISTDQWAEALDRSRDRVLAAGRTGRYAAAALAQATAARMVAAWTLAPASVDPVAHVEAGHADARRHLVRLLEHGPAAEVRSPMTNQIFSRLTRSGAGHARIDYTSFETYTYTPRKPLRRVLDHALDHLNQIDQWQLWRREGVVPTPTDGWAPSTVTLPEDRLPLTVADLDAWLWRIDQAVHLLARRAAGLTDDELDWQPPDGGWPLRRVLHHVARSEMLYAASLDDALPENPGARYAEADSRFQARLMAAQARGMDRSIAYPNLYGTMLTPEKVVDELLSCESEVVEQTT